jgi:predicted amidophosphoribosyltransferase
MEQFIEGIFYGLIGGSIVLVLKYLQPAKVCPNCKEKLPKVFYGGCTCPECGSKIDRYGKIIEE